MRGVMAHETRPRMIESRKPGRQEVRRAANVKRPQAFVCVSRKITAVRGGELRIVGICDGVEISRADSRVFETPARRLLRKFPCGERHANLPVLSARESLFFGRCNDLAVDYESCCRIVKHGINTQNAHEK